MPFSKDKGLRLELLDRPGVAGWPKTHGCKKNNLGDFGVNSRNFVRPLVEGAAGVFHRMEGVL